MEDERPLRLGLVGPHDECDPTVLCVRVRTGMRLAFQSSRCFGPRRPSEALGISRSSAPFFSPPPPLGACAGFGGFSHLIFTDQGETCRDGWALDVEVGAVSVDEKYSTPCERLTTLPALRSLDLDD